MPAATADLSECCQVLQNQFLGHQLSIQSLLDANYQMQPLFITQPLSSQPFSFHIFKLFRNCSVTAVYIIWATDIDLHSNKMFRQLHWPHLKFGLFTCKGGILLPPKTHLDNLNLKSSKTSCASCFSPRKTQIKQICINYHIYSQQTLALSTAKWVVWEMQGKHF